MPTFDFEFEVVCSCGDGLCNQSDTKQVGKAHVVIVEPCQKCLASEYDKGKEEGKEEGIEEAREEARKDIEENYVPKSSI